MDHGGGWLRWGPLQTNHSVDVRGALEADETEAVRAAVVSGMGIGILPLYMTGDALRQGQLVLLLRDYEVATDSVIHLVYVPNSTLPSRVRPLIDFLVARFGPVPPWEDAARRAGTTNDNLGP